MRKKIKQLMNKEEGFTLIELLAVIVILGIIVAIAVPQIGNVINRATTGAEAAEKELVVDAARLYMLEDPADAPTTDGVVIFVSVDDLITAGYLEDITGTETSLVTTNGVTVTANVVGDSVNYTYAFALAAPAAPAAPA